MTFGVTNEFNTNETAFVDGKKVTVVSSYTDYVVVVDENGNRSSVRKDALMTTPLFNFQNQELKQEREDKIAYYQDKAEEAGKQKKDFLTQIKDLFSQLSHLDKNDEQYKLVKDEYWAARMNKTAAGNREYGFYLDAYLVASDTSNWS